MMIQRAQFARFSKDSINRAFNLAHASKGNLTQTHLVFQGNKTFYDPFAWHRAINKGLEFYQEEQWRMAYLSFQEAYQVLRPDEVELKIETLNKIALASDGMEDYETSEKHLNMALALDSRPKFPLLHLVTLNHLADLYYFWGKFDQAESFYRQGLAFLEKRYAFGFKGMPPQVEEDLTLAKLELQLGLGKSLVRLKCFDDTVSNLESGLDMLLKARIPHPRKQQAIESAQHYLSMAYLGVGNYDRALAYLDDTIETHQALHGEKSRGLLRLLENKVDLLEKSRRYSAVAEVEEQIDSLKRENDGSNPFSQDSDDDDPPPEEFTS